MKSRSCDELRGAPWAGGARRGIDEQAGEPFVEAYGRRRRLRLSHEIGHPQGDAPMDARIELDPHARQTILSEVGFRRETLERLALGARMCAIDVSHARCPFSPGDFVPRNPLTRSLASRFAGSLRSRGSLRSARSRPQPCQISLVRRSSHDDCTARASAAPSSDGVGVSAR